MKKIKYIAISALLVVMFASCGTLTKTSSFTPNNVELQISMNDLNCLGETEVSVSYRTYLGFFSVVDEINGDIYDPTNVKTADLEGFGINLITEKHLNKAAYKVVELYPGAAYYQVVSKTKSKDRLFLGNEVTVTARIRAYSFK